MKRKNGKVWMILVGLSLLFFLLLEKMKNSKKFTPDDAKAAIKRVFDTYGAEMAKTVERIWRLETAHFKSGQYVQTGSAGMEVGKWKGLPANVSSVPFKDNHDGHIGNFIKWNDAGDFAVYLAEYIQRHGGDYARWNTTSEAGKEVYRNKVNSIKPYYTTEILNA